MKIDKKMALLWFYLATPVFVLLDLIFDWDIRVSFLDEHAGWKYLYYTFCLAIGLVMWKLPALEAILGMVEGGVNMLLLTLSVMLPYYASIDLIANGEEIKNPLDNFGIFNYLLSGCFLLISMQMRNLEAGKR